MYVSRLLFHTVPGKTREVEQELKKLRDMESAATGATARILHTHFASLGAADAVFEQEAAEPSIPFRSRPKRSLPIRQQRFCPRIAHRLP